MKVDLRRSSARVDAWFMLRPFLTAEPQRPDEVARKAGLERIQARNVLMWAAGVGLCAESFLKDEQKRPRPWYALPSRPTV